MGDYGEIVELGLEGVDRFATHFHDPVVDKLSKHKPFSRSRNKRDSGPSGGPQRQERRRELPEDERPSQRPDSPQRRESFPEQDLPPHPQLQVPPPPPGAPPAGLPYPPYQPYPGGLPSAIPVVPTVPYSGVQFAAQPPRRQLPRQRSYSDPRGERYDSRSVPDNIGEIDSDSDVERGPRSMYSSYAPGRGRDDGWRDDGRYERVVEDREYYGPRGTVQQMAVRTRDANHYQGAVTPRAPSPPDYGYAQRGYADGMAVRGRPEPRRQRSSSWSPPRRAERRHDSPARRKRSKSPNHHRALAIIVGALAGGVAGSRVKKDDLVPNTMATVGGAILGGLAGREVEQEFDRHKERRTHRAYERGEAREKRRLEREHDYD
ncbi:uncharacterized protein CC84DRAFT_1220438 [Paraphaeosphaeria sporulosa]|uniref:Glycine zipper 2TM domain-containing protein n=1 Tax=Paraphaeosphaeria sporulosa TaxID=1460663 RepID=A0A177C3U7_9PLEO|nr:uncharacterized protein CC84DRAFT_1220438 [Paraphaeosphaeria sporulosa]OAG02076.1 hypothetical protein CC84DRAFT_1220438 [Paraphaeosphaeria sporulosa]